MTPQDSRRLNKIAGFSLIEMMVVLGIMAVAISGVIDIVQMSSKAQKRAALVTTRAQIMSRMNALLNDPNALLISAGQVSSDSNAPSQGLLFGCIANNTGGPTNCYSRMFQSTQMFYIPEDKQPNNCNGTTYELNDCSGKPQAQCLGWVSGETDYLGNTEKMYCTWDPNSGKCVLLTTNALTKSTLNTSCPTTDTQFDLYDQINTKVAEYYDTFGLPAKADSNYAYRVRPYFRGSSPSSNRSITFYFKIEVGPGAKKLGISDIQSPNVTLSTPLNAVNPTANDICNFSGGTLYGTKCKIPDASPETQCTNLGLTWNSTNCSPCGNLGGMILATSTPITSSNSHCQIPKPVAKHFCTPDEVYYATSGSVYQCKDSTWKVYASSLEQKCIDSGGQLAKAPDGATVCHFTASGCPRGFRQHSGAYQDEFNCSGGGDYKCSYYDSPNCKKRNCNPTSCTSTHRTWNYSTTGTTSVAGPCNYLVKAGNGCSKSGCTANDGCCKSGNNCDLDTHPCTTYRVTHIGCDLN